MKIILIVFCCFLTLTVAADEKYVTDSTVNTALHSTESVWNNTNGSASPDYAGTMVDISQTATSPDGLITVTLQTDDITYTLDFGQLDFDALDPIESTKCFFSIQVNKLEAKGSGSVTASTQNGQKSFSCNTVKMGVKNFIISGDVNVGDTITFSNIVFDIDSSDYYFSFPCTIGSQVFLAYNAESMALPSQYASILKSALKSANSQFSRKTRSKTKSKGKSGIKGLLNQELP